MSHLSFMNNDDDEDDPLNDDDGFGAFSPAEGGMRPQKALVVFLIDCHKSMLKQRAFADKDGQEESYAQRAIRAVYDVAKDKVKRAQPDHVGVVFFNTKTKKNKWDHEGVHVALPLQEPSVAAISTLKELAEGKGLPEASDDDGSAASKSSLELGIWCCQQTFNESTVKEGKRAVFVLTCRDDPLRGKDPTPCLRRVQDCKEGGIGVDVFPLSHARALERDGPDPPPEEFSASKFYRELMLKFQKDDDDERWSRDAIEQKITRRLLVQLKEEIEGGIVTRSLASLPFLLSKGSTPADDVAIGVKIYALSLETKPKGHVWLDAKSNKGVKSVTEKLCTATGRLLLDHDIESFFPYGASELPFSAAEVAECKAMDMSPGLQLLGFMDSSLLSPKNNLRAPYFVRPDDARSAEGGKTFRALWQVLLSDQKVALCSFRSRSNVPPKLVALCADSEGDADADRRESGEAIVPDGFHLVFLPYKDDLRTIPPVASAEKPSEEAVTAGIKLIKKVRYADVDPTAFTNPVIQNHLAVLEAISLQDEVNEEEMKEVLEVLEPEPETVGNDKVVSLCSELKAAVHSDYDENIAGPAPKARAAPKRKKTDDDGGASDVDWKALFASGGLEGETVASLKEGCRSLGLPVSGTKATLVERIKTKLS